MKHTVVAIFEDDLVSRYIYEKMFRNREDITAFIFDSPERGYEKLKDTRVDLVFIEAHFRQNFGGVRILETLRPLVSERTVFIAMTSLLQKGDLEQLMGAGFQLCLEKPIAFDEVIAP